MINIYICVYRKLETPTKSRKYIFVIHFPASSSVRGTRQASVWLHNRAWHAHNDLLPVIYIVTAQCHTSSCQMIFFLLLFVVYKISYNYLPYACQRFQLFQLYIYINSFGEHMCIAGFVRFQISIFLAGFSLDICKNCRGQRCSFYLVAYLSNVQF